MLARLATLPERPWTGTLVAGACVRCHQGAEGGPEETVPQREQGSADVLRRHDRIVEEEEGAREDDAAGHHQPAARHAGGEPPEHRPLDDHRHQPQEREEEPHVVAPPPQLGGDVHGKGGEEDVVRQKHDELEGQQVADLGDGEDSPYAQARLLIEADRFGMTVPEDLADVLRDESALGMDPRWTGERRPGQCGVRSDFHDAAEALLPSRFHCGTV